MDLFCHFVIVAFADETEKTQCSLLEHLAINYHRFKKDILIDTYLFLIKNIYAHKESLSDMIQILRNMVCAK